MKTLKLISAVLIVTITACSSKIFQTADNSANAIDNTTAVPSGTYFILNSSGALTPLSPSVGQNVFLQRFTKSGVQKWDIKQHKTNKGIYYTIKAAGSDNLYFQPFAVKDHTPVIGTAGNNTSYRIVAAGAPKAWYIKSNFYNGDAMRSFVFSPNLPTEIRFEAPEATDKFMWKLIPAGD